MPNQGSQGGSSEQHRKAGEQSHKTDDKQRQSGRDTASGKGAGSGGAKSGAGNTGGGRSGDRKS